MMNDTNISANNSRWFIEGNNSIIPVEGNQTLLPKAPLAMLIIMPVVAAWTTTSNLCVAIVLLTNKACRRDSHLVVITSLALSDSMGGLACVTPALIYLFPEFFQNRMICSAAFNAIFITVSATAIHIILICIERIIAVTKPYKFKQLFTIKRSLIYSIGIWVFSSAGSSVLPILSLRSENFVSPELCSVQGLYEPEGIAVFYGCIWFLILFVIAAPVFGFLLLMMKQQFGNIGRNKIACITVTEQHQKEDGVRQHASNENTTSRKSRAANRSDGRKFITIVVLFVLFTVTLLPNNVAFLVQVIFDKVYIKQEHRFLLGYLWAVNSSINPIVYALAADKFKLGMRSIIFKCLKPLQTTFRGRTTVAFR